MRGTKNKSRQQIQDEIDRLKAQMNVSGSATSATASIETVEANLPGALRLAAEILREPSFPESEFEQSGSSASPPPKPAAASRKRSAITEIAAPHEPLPARRRALRRHRRRNIEDLKKVTLDDVREVLPAVLRRQRGRNRRLRTVRHRGNRQTGRRTLRRPGRAPAATRASPTCTGRSPPPIRRSRPPTNPTRFSSPARWSKCNDEDPDYPADHDGQLHVRRQRPRHPPVHAHPR